MSGPHPDVSTPAVNLNDAFPPIDHPPSSEDPIDIHMDTAANISTTRWWKTRSWVSFGEIINDHE